MLEELFGLLEPGGHFYARTPWAVPLKRLYGGYPLQYPMHLHDLGPAFWNRIGSRHDVEIVVSRPSLVASGFSLRELPRTLTAYMLKAPAHLEGFLRRSPRDPLWRLAGGWEVVLRQPPPGAGAKKKE